MRLCGSGSSPLTRGKRYHGDKGPRNRRLIPAHAGKTASASIFPSHASAHPRSRGENMQPATTAQIDAGSSPLTRGKRTATPPASLGSGLIPAHAGKTATRSRITVESSAHPRSRGENYQAHSVAIQAGGSSPLTRGKLQILTGGASIRRLIPAHAGKTIAFAACSLTAAAHPRSRGENLDPCRPYGDRRGSSPLTRGKHFPTCAFTAQIDQILETLELAVSSGSYSVWVACATDAPQDQVRSIGLVLPSSRGAS